jgi:hypothetical protein
MENFLEKYKAELLAKAIPLTALEPSWVYLTGPTTVKGICGPPPEELQSGPKVGISFACPTCPSGHRIAIPFKTCPLEAGWLAGKDIRWDHSGDTYETLTVKPSINCDHGGCCRFHGWITGGKVTW